MRGIDGKLICQQYDPDLWHQPDTERKAIGLCLGCPALAPCLDLSTNPANQAWTAYGVWGGMNARDRARIRDRRADGEVIRDRNVTFTTTDCRTLLQDLSS